MASHKKPTFTCDFGFLVRWNASADTCSFFFLSSSSLFCIWPIYIWLISPKLIISIYLSAVFPFTCNSMWFIKLRASAGISGYMWGVRESPRVCAGVCRSAQVCAGVCRCVRTLIRIQYELFFFFFPQKIRILFCRVLGMYYSVILYNL